MPFATCKELHASLPSSIYVSIHYLRREKPSAISLTSDWREIKVAGSELNLLI